MKNLLICSISLTTQLLWAGVSSSGGGYAVVCRDEKKQIISAELLDLYEGRVKHHFDIIKSSGSALKDYTESVDKTYSLQLKPNEKFQNCDGCRTSSENFELFMKQATWKNSNKQLKQQYDLGDVSQAVSSLQQGCDIEPAAVFNDDVDRVQIAKDIWNKFDSLSQAALVQHEMFYRDARQYYLLPEKTSENTRLNVGIIFSNNGENVKIGIPDNADFNLIKHNLNANTDGQFSSTSFYRFEIGHENGKTVYRSQFDYIAGRAVLSKTYVDIPSSVKISARFYLKSLQFDGWYIEILSEQDMNANDWITVRLFNKSGLAVTDLQ